MSKWYCSRCHVKQFTYPIRASGKKFWPLYETVDGSLASKEHVICQSCNLDIKKASGALVKRKGYSGPTYVSWMHRGSSYRRLSSDQMDALVTTGSKDEQGIDENDTTVTNGSNTGSNGNGINEHDNTVTDGYENGTNGYGMDFDTMVTNGSVNGSLGHGTDYDDFFLKVRPSGATKLKE